MMIARFPLGDMVITSDLLSSIDPDDFVALGDCLARHCSGDWGDLDPEDKTKNERALTDGERILSAYTLPSGRSIWVTTDRHRSATTILRPEDYMDAKQRRGRS